MITKKGYVIFPYTFPNLIVAWAILFGVIHSIFTNKNFVVLELLQGLVIFGVFIFVAKKFYKKKPNTLKGKTLAISYNLGILPILFANGYALVFLLNDGSLSDAIMIYLAPIIYTPIIFFISLVVVYLVQWQLKYKIHK